MKKTTQDSPKLLTPTKELVVKIRGINPASIAREDELGRLNFREVVPDAARLVGAYSRLELGTLDDLTEGQLEEIWDAARQDLGCLEGALEFEPGKTPRPKKLADVKRVRAKSTFSVYSPKSKKMGATKEGEVMTVDEARAAFRGDDNGLWHAIIGGQFDPMMDDDARDEIADEIRGAYDRTFPVLLIYICHGIARLTNVNEIGETARKTEHLLNQVRETAAEQGVFMQTGHFKEEADRHEAEAKTWRERVGMAVAAFVGAAFLSWWWSGDVDNGFALAQALTSRALVFVALGFGVFFCAKNYLAHRHNAVVNRHRQKALETYRALAEADPKSREVVLAHAARCIYAPQDSGFARKGESGGGEIPVETILRFAERKGDE